EMFARFIPDGDIGQYANLLPALLKTEFTETMKLLRNPEFQRLLLDYPRAKRPFWVSYQPDDVQAERMLRFGKFDRAEDYLDAFSRFVKENADKVDALAILLNRPRDWRP